jgi:uncharacterized membrane-anchored protein
MKNYILITVFAVMVLAQWYVPASMIIQHEKALQKGTVLKFRTQIYDPYDPFRGRYVQLNFEMTRNPIQVTDTEDTTQTYHHEWKEAYVILAQDEKGFARAIGVSDQRPAQGIYMRTRVRRYGDGYNIRLPFDRYFMNEKAAPKAERIYLDANRAGQGEGSSDENYALVRIYQGTAVIEALYVDGQPIEALLKGSQ